VGFRARFGPEIAGFVRFGPQLCRARLSSAEVASALEQGLEQGNWQARDSNAADSISIPPAK